MILRPRRDAPVRWAVLDRGVSADFMADGRQQPDGQSRPALDDAFE